MASVVDLGIVVDGYSVITYTLENSVVICQFGLDIVLHHGCSGCDYTSRPSSWKAQWPDLDSAWWNLF
jgi:hypothetical protein